MRAGGGGFLVTKGGRDGGEPLDGVLGVASVGGTTARGAGAGLSGGGFRRTSPGVLGVIPCPPRARAAGRGTRTGGGGTGPPPRAPCPVGGNRGLGGTAALGNTAGGA